ncbi:MAG TPA: Holliday junction resolvase RuvX [Beutenbergiaceae bacterium]|nr:Holliday junction resolvase RuvX [Beutenbergiaceae bacterium]
MPDEDEPVPMRRGVRIGVDAGQVRVGLATSDPEGMLATPHSTIRRSRSADGVAQIAQLVRQTGAIEVVVGLPLHMSGTESPASRGVRSYAERLARTVDPVPVRLVDERLSTVSAHSQLHRAGRPGRSHRQVVDQVAATVILQAALDGERSGHAPGEVVRVDQGAAAEESGT